MNRLATQQGRRPYLQMHIPRGVTLIELMVGVSIVAILLAVALPSFRDSVTQNRISSITNDFMGAMSYARSEAIKRGTAVCLCKSASGTACDSGSTTWAGGWIVFQNTDGDSPPVVDSGEPILKVFQALPANYTLTATSALASYVCYDRYGMAGGTGTLAACRDSDETKARAITVLVTRARLATDTDGDGIPNKEANGAVAGNITNCESP